MFHFFTKFYLVCIYGCVSFVLVEEETLQRLNSAKPWSQTSLFQRAHIRTRLWRAVLTGCKNLIPFIISHVHAATESYFTLHTKCGLKLNKNQKWGMFVCVFASVLVLAMWSPSYMFTIKQPWRYFWFHFHRNWYCVTHCIICAENAKSLYCSIWVEKSFLIIICYPNKCWDDIYS